MKTELQISVIYLAKEENDINNFDFYIRMFPAEDKTIVSVCVVPRYSLNGKTVKHIRFSVRSDCSLNADEVLIIIADLKELEIIVSNVELSAEKAQKHLMNLMTEHLRRFGKDRP